MDAIDEPIEPAGIAETSPGKPRGTQTVAGPETAPSQIPGETRRGPGKGSRQGRTPGKPRQFRHVVKVHPHVEEQLLLLAAPRGITVSRLLVESALAGGADAARLRSELGAELFRVGQFLGKVGVNVNQIARATNATLETQPETVAAMAAVQRVCNRLDELLDEVEVPR